MSGCLAHCLPSSPHPSFQPEAFAPTMQISSASNPRYKSWQKALDSRGIRKQNEAILAGKKFLSEVLRDHPERVQAVLLRDGMDAPQAPGALPGNIQMYSMPAELFAALDIYGTDAPLMLISAPEPPVWGGSLPPGLTLFLPFQNPINLGTIIRSAAAFGAQVVVLKEAANIYHPKTLRAAGPGLFKTTIMQGPSLAGLAEYIDLPLFALGLNGENLFKFKFPQSFGLVAGMEGPGLEAVWPKRNLLTIPMQPGVESLNAAAAVDISLGAIFAGGA